MKKYAILLILPFVFASCEKWLDVRPFDSIEVDDVFPNENATNSALNGLYVSLSLDTLYGKDMSCGALEVLAQHFNVPYNAAKVHEYYQLNDYDYTHADAKAVLRRVFSASYRTIADANEFMQQITEVRSGYVESRYNQYMGEALGLRTYLHFDMLRLFGPMPDDLDRDAIPYYSSSTDTPQPIIPAVDLIDSLLRDIDVAIRYLEDDPVRTSGTQMVQSDVDFFSSYRNLRMNYYAAQALKARMLLYRGDEPSKNQAYSVAVKLLEDGHFSRTFTFKKINIIENVYADEIIFGFHNSLRNEVYKALFTPDLDASEMLSGGVDFINALYGRTEEWIGGEDLGVRPDMWSYNALSGVYEFTRYRSWTNYAQFPYHNEMMCLFRLGELYAIAAETAPDVESKRYWIEQLRVGKGYDPGNANDLTEDQLDQLIAVEFEKETYGEGQYFFFAKRQQLNLTSQSGTSVTMTRAEYVPPLPEVETNYRNNQQD